MIDIPAFRSAFPRQLRYWTLHCLINALPSLIIAAGWMKLLDKPAAMAGMFTGIASFILLYAVVTAASSPLSSRTHILARSLRLGAKIRVWISLGSLPLLINEKWLMWAPDTWCGMASVWLTSAIRSLPGNRGFAGWSGKDFVPVYITTMLEGIILSFFLLMISFFALIFVQARERKKAFPVSA